MPQEMLTIGPPTALTQNITYAMPARNTVGYTSDTAATLTAAMVADMTGAETVTIGADGSFSTRAPFIRCTSGNITVRLQAA